MHGKTTEIFLANGTADGIVTAEISNWNGKVIKIPESSAPWVDEQMTQNLWQNPFNVEITPGLEKGVEEMCNLSAGIERQGIEKGSEKGIEKGKSEMIDFIARISKYSKEKIAEIGRLDGLL